MNSRAFLYIWCCYIVLAPFYVFQSGYPQPADFILICGILPCLIFSFLRPHKALNIYVSGACFAGLTLLVNIVHYIFLPDIRFILSSLYYVYNFLIFVFIVSASRGQEITFAKMTYYCVVFTIVLQFILLVFLGVGAEGNRPTGTFNNPNQLGYWSLLSACLVFVLKGRDKLSPLDYFVLALLFYIQLLSLSKAVMLTFSFVLLIGCLSPIANLYQKIALGFLFAGLIIFALFNTQQIVDTAMNNDVTGQAIKRLSSIGSQNDDSLEGRGYLRLLSHPEYILLGAGEGGFARFPPKYSNQEIHSGIVTMIFSYGILGASMFAIFLYFVFRRAPWFYAAFMVPIVAYGLTHQNFRNSYFWGFLAAVYVMSVLWQKTKRHQPPKRENINV